jgi:riboflavin kinase/FMN adenylyltransferase
MKIYRGLGEAPLEFGPSALTIGNFDGVHSGHRRILRRLVEIARARRWKSSVVTFDPHPTRLVTPERAPRLLTTPERRAELMGEEGVDQVLIMPFTRQVAQLPAEEFVSQLLVGRLGARAVAVGENFRFGRGHAGNVHLLEGWGSKYGFQMEIVRAVSWRGRVVSSTGIRQLVLAGRVSLAARHLLRPYRLEGEVVSGRGIGSRQTVPTLNLATRAEIVPAGGVYVTRTFDPASRRAWDSITNIGFRPTFGPGGLSTIETFLLDPFDGNTPRSIQVDFLWRLRQEVRFHSPEALKAQILKDAAAARRYFRRARAWIGRTVTPA